MKLIYLYAILTAITLFEECRSYRILGVFPINAKSHNVVFEELMKGLVKRGHQVDVITHFPLKKPLKNYNDIINLDGAMEDFMNNCSIDYMKGVGQDIVQGMVVLNGNRICDFMGFESMQRLFKNPPTNPPYDAIIVEAFAANCYFGLGRIFKAPVIAISSAVEYPWVSEFIGNNDNLAVVPNAFLTETGKMTYWERVKNVVLNHLALREFHASTEKYQTEAMRKYLSPDMPNIREVEKSVALTLVNSHPIVFGVKPVLPTLVQIAGLHIEENNATLPAELKQWMDESQHGVVCFTLGSMLLIETLPADTLKELYDSFKKIAPIRVLMKVVNESMLPPGLPENVKTMRWIPQLPLLAHPNTKIFITHGGLGGCLEALYNGVPMIGMPLFADQFRNCEAFVAKEMMVRIDLTKLSGKVLDSALMKLIRNPTYKKNAVYYSKLFRDQPISQMDKAIYWIDYVIRNGNVLRPLTLDFEWWQLALLDVYGLFALVLILSLTLIFISLALAVKKFLKVFTRIVKRSAKILKKNQ